MNARLGLRLLGKVGYVAQGMNFNAQLGTSSQHRTTKLQELAANSQRGLWKWEHYYDIYERHFQRFVGNPVSLLEVGVMGGGSLDLWRLYFGHHASIYGADINPECREPNVFIGDQGSPAFWGSFKKQVPKLDIVIDDGSHRPDDQIVTLESLLPHLSAGGVYLCEDIHGIHNGFTEYVHGMVKNLNAMEEEPSETQKWISLHSYPYVAVIEKRESPITKLHAPRIGFRS
jgi:hypothetical protein